MAEGGYEEIPMEERGHDEDHDDEADESTPLFPDGNQNEGWTEGRRPSSHRSSSRHQYETRRGSTSGFANPSYVSDVNEGARLLADKEKDHSVLEEIRRKFPYFDPPNANFIFGEDEFGRVYVELKRKGGRKHFLYDGNGNLNKDIPKTVTTSLGPSAEELIGKKDEEIEELREENEGLRGTIRGRTSLRETENRKSREMVRKYEERIKEGEEKISALKDESRRLNEEKKHLKGEKDEELKRVKEINEAEVERLKNDYKVHNKERDEFYNDKISSFNRNYEEHIRGIMAKYERETGEVEDQMREKDKQISDLSKGLRSMQMSMEDLNEELAETRKKTLTVEEQKVLEESEMKIEENEERIDELTREREAIQERLTLRERVKLIFKKHGLTALGIVTAVGTVIGVIVSNLKSGLAKVAKGVGDGLKELGKKLAQLLPGMIGAIAKYIFNAAGEAIGFLAKNTWLLIVAAVVYAVEQFKKKNK